MATLVYQGLQSCLESSQVSEPTTIRLKLLNLKPNFYQSADYCSKSSLANSEIIDKKIPVVKNVASSSSSPSSPKPKPDNSCWNFFKEPQKKSAADGNVYVHPLCKKQEYTVLSAKSLELCTETLGNETGVIDVIDSSIFASMSLSESEVVNSPTREQKKENSGQLYGATKGKFVRNFPPPLTTMSGSECLRVRSHRENGRLVIQAVKTPVYVSPLKAERTEGRLRLTYVPSNVDREDENMAELDENDNSDEMFVEEEEEFKYEYDESDDEDGDAEEEEEGMHRNILEVKDEMEIEELEMATRCRENEVENIGKLTWEQPFLVAAT